MGRRLKSDALTPIERVARSKRALVAAGGKRVSINLPVEVVQRIERLQERYPEDAAYSTTAIILRALRNHDWRTR